MTRSLAGIASRCLGALLTLAVPSAEAQEGQSFRTILGELNRVPARDANLVTNEGLLKSAPAETLTRERIYALALIRARDRGTAPAPALDPKAMDQQAARLEVGDFGRFRRDFLAGDPGGFRDPSARYFELLGRFQAIENALGHLTYSEKLLQLVQELVNGEASGLSQIQVDDVNDLVQKARLDLVERRARYRDSLDEFKVELGLMPGAMVVLDREPLSKFRAIFDDLIRWSAGPSREFEKLDELVSALPALGDFVVDGRSLLDPDTSAFDRLEDLVSAAGKVAVANRGQADAPLELRVRRMIRKLSELAIGYRIDQRRLVLGLRQVSMAEEGILAPKQPNRDGAANLAMLVDLQAEIRDCEDRLVESWASYHSLRLALYRDLKMLPAADWKAFHDQVLGGRDDPARGPAGPRPPQGPPAAPLAPPASGTPALPD